MLIGPPTPHNCPHCNTLHQLKGYLSGNSFSAITWSDGYTHMPHAPKEVHAGRCAACKAIIWHDELASQPPPDIPVDDDTYELPGVPWLRQLGPRELVEAVAKAEWRNVDDEQYLRLKLWHAMNHPLRQKQMWWWQPEDVFSPEERTGLYTANADALDALIAKQPASAGSLLMRADLRRMTGRFDEAQAMLEQVTDEALLARLSVVREGYAQRSTLPLPLVDPKPQTLPVPQPDRGWRTWPGRLFLWYVLRRW